MVYGNIQTGYIPFGYSPDAGDPADELKRSKLLAFSGGFKSRLLGNSLEINSEFFYYDYKNFQAFTVSQLTFLAVPAIADKRTEEHTSELQSLMRISYAVFCLTNTKNEY